MDIKPACSLMSSRGRLVKQSLTVQTFMGNRVYCSADLRSADTPDEFTVRVAGFRCDRMKNEARSHQRRRGQMFRCVRTTCTEPHTDIVRSASLGGHGCFSGCLWLLIIFKAFVGFLFVSRYKASFELGLFRKSVLLFSHSCRLNISWNEVFL